MKKYLFSFLVLLIFLISELNAQWSTDPTINTLISNATGDQEIVQISSSSDGGYLMVWGDKRNGSTNKDIYAQKVNSLGVVQWTANGLAICTATGNQNNGSIITDGSGGAIITWNDPRSGTDDIYAQRINSSGIVQWTANGVVVCNAASSQTAPKILVDGSGGGIITWYDNRSGNNDIYAQRINSSGAAQWAANGVVVCNATGAQNSPELISDGSSGAIISWYDNRSGNYDIYAQRINSSGTVQWTANGVVICNATGAQYSPKLISDGSSGAVLTWYDNRSGNYDIYAQRINSSGTVQWTANGVVICNASGNKYYPTIASDGSGGGIITWMDSRGADNDIYAQKINGGTVQWTANGIAICSATGSQSSPIIISDDSGGAIITWNDQRIGQTHIYTQKVNSGGTAQWTSDGVATGTYASGFQNHQVITTDGSGGAIVTWMDYRSGYDIYAQYINTNGVLGVLFPTVTTTSVTDISVTTATGGGNVTSDGGASVTARGVCWSTSTNPTTANSKTADGTGTGTYTSSITGLLGQTLYHVRSYATNSAGTSYGSDVTFSTVPTLPEWGLIILFSLSLILGGWFVIKKF